MTADTEYNLLPMRYTGHEGFKALYVTREVSKGDPCLLPSFAVHREIVQDLPIFAGEGI